jgi:methionyl-tRNA formyltransferase
VRTVLLANNRLGARIAAYLAQRGELDALVLHPVERRSEAEAFDAIDAAVPRHTWPDGLDAITGASTSAGPPECLLSVLFAYKVPPAWLAAPTWRAINLHPGLLPWNRGAAPNVWPLVDGSPAGTTLHVMEEAIDTGAILSQVEVATFPDDTAFTLYQRLEDASYEMFAEAWPRVASLSEAPQPPGGSSHRLADLTSLDLTDSDLATLDKLRARTFARYGAEFERDGRRYAARVEIEPLD